MKMYLLLILSAIMLSFMTAYHFIGLQNQTVARPADIKKILELQKIFLEKNKPVIELDLTAIYPSQRYSQLFAPVNVFSRKESNKRAYFSSGCSKRHEVMSKLYYNKSETWEDFRCQRLDSLPPRFFEDPPYIHETGLSYVFLAYNSNFLDYTDNEWIRNHLNLFHVTELQQLPVKSLEPQFRVLARLKKKELDLIVRGFKHVLSEDHYLVKDDRGFDVSYNVFNRITFEKFLKENNYYLRASSDKEYCYFRIGRTCLEKDNIGMMQFFKQSSISVLVISIVILILISLLLLRKIKQSKFEEERKKHALRVLTHELRTPIANLMLLVEDINKQSDLLAPGLLENFLKVEGEVYRLKRLAEKSTNYLQNHEGKSFIFLTPQYVDSLEELINNVAAQFEKDKVRVIPLKKDTDLSIDIYWFGICLKNLIENAINHGTGLVEVSASEVGENIVFEVKDEGRTNIKKLDEFIKGVHRPKHSSGLGLGLSLVQKIIGEMDGKLLYKPDPTRFYLVIKKKISPKQDMII